MNQNNSLLIITSSVHVSSLLTQITNSKDREKQYVDSITFYLTKTNINQIIICDNSGFDYSTYNFDIFAKKQNKKIELLTFDGNKNAIEKQGKGYGEGEIIKFVFENSSLIKSNSSFFKITGRIIIKNINHILNNTEPEKNYFQQTRTRFLFPQNKVDTRIYYCQKDVFKNSLYDAYLKVNDFKGYYLEHAYYTELETNRISYHNFKSIPKFDGVSGSTGMTYNEPKLKWFIKQIINSIIILRQSLRERRII